jgi:hypothetical protein
VKREWRQELSELHTKPVFEQMIILERIAHIWYIFNILSPMKEDRAEIYYKEIINRDKPLGISLLAAMDRKDENYSCLELVGRYLIGEIPPLERLLTREEKKRAKARSLKGKRELLELLL